MRKLMIVAGVPLSMTVIGVLGASPTTHAASLHESSKVATAHQQSSFFAGEDGDDDDVPQRRSSGGGSSSSGGGGGGSLPATGIEATSLALLGALTIAAGGATYRLSTRRAHP
jgi:LPXTG-motif cell wall-anchored protein